MRKKQLGRINLSDPLSPKVDLISKKSFQEDLRAFKDGAKVWLSVETYYKQRSLKQNNMIHAYFQEIADQTKMSLESVKRAMKAQFLTVDVLDDEDNIVVNKVTGEPLRQVRDTSDLTTVEAMTFCEEMRVFLMDFDVYLTPPDEQVELRFRGLE